MKLANLEPWKWSHDTDFPDTRIVCRDGNVSAHRAVLSCYSNLLHKMFLDVDEESKDNNKYYLLLPDYYRLQIIKVLQVMYREVEESLTSCELVQALCLNIPPHKQQDRSIFDLEEEEVENLPLHDQHDLQVLQNGDDMEVACNEEVCDGQESSVEESSDEYQTPDDSGGETEKLARLRSHRLPEKGPTLPESLSHPGNQPKTVAATTVKCQQKETENRNLVYLISETDFVESENPTEANSPTEENEIIYVDCKDMPENGESHNTFINQSEQNSHFLEAEPSEHVEKNVVFATENVHDNVINIFNENDIIQHQQIESDIPPNYIEAVEYVETDQIHPESFTYTENVENTEIISTENIAEMSADIYTEEQNADELLTYEVAEIQDTAQFFEHGGEFVTATDEASIPEFSSIEGGQTIHLQDYIQEENEQVNTINMDNVIVNDVVVQDVIDEDGHIVSLADGYPTEGTNDETTQFVDANNLSSRSDLVSDAIRETFTDILTGNSDLVSDYRNDHEQPEVDSEIQSAVFHLQENNLQQNEEELNYECSVCLSKFLSSESVSRHIGSDHPVCHVCGQLFNNQPFLKQHLFEMHDYLVEDLENINTVPENHILVQEEKFRCEECSLSFTKIDHLNMHKLGAHSKVKQTIHTDDYDISIMDNNESSCFFCPEKFNTIEELNQHVINNHQIMIQQVPSSPREICYLIRCSLCKKEYTELQQLEDHIGTEHSLAGGLESSISCFYCDQPFPQAKMLHSHYTTFHKSAPKKFECHICNKVYVSWKNVHNHIVNHEDSTAVHAFQCGQCSISFRTRLQLLKHIVACQKDNPTTRIVLTTPKTKPATKKTPNKTSPNQVKKGGGRTGPKALINSDKTNIIPGNENIENLDTNPSDFKPKKNRSLKKKFESKLIKDHHTENKEKTKNNFNTVENTANIPENKPNKKRISKKNNTLNVTTSRDVNTNDVLNETVNDSVSKTLIKTVQNTNNRGIKDNVYSNFQIENKSENKTEVLEEVARQPRERRRVKPKISSDFIYTSLRVAERQTATAAATSAKFVDISFEEGLTSDDEEFVPKGDETIESDFDEDIDKLNTKDDLEITFKSKQNISEALVDESEIETVSPNDSLQANEMETEILSKSNKSSCKVDNTNESITKDPKANEDLNVSVESLEKKISRKETPSKNRNFEQKLKLNKSNDNISLPEEIGEESERRTYKDLYGFEITEREKKNRRCLECGFTNERADRVREHIIRFHTKDFPFNCDKCKRGFLRPGTLGKHNCLSVEPTIPNIQTFNINEINSESFSKMQLKLKSLTAKEIEQDTNSNYKCIFCMFESTNFIDFNKHWKNAHLNKEETSKLEDDTETTKNEDIIIDKEIVSNQKERTNELPQDSNQMLLDRLPSDITVSKVCPTFSNYTLNHKESPEINLPSNKEDDIQIISQINTKQINITPIKLQRKPINIAPKPSTNITLLSPKSNSLSNNIIFISNPNQPTVSDKNKYKETNLQTSITITHQKLPMLKPKIFGEQKATIFTTNLSKLENEKNMPESSITIGEQNQNALEITKLVSKAEINVTVAKKRPRGRPASQKIQDDAKEIQHIPKKAPGRPRKKFIVLQQSDENNLASKKDRVQDITDSDTPLIGIKNVSVQIPRLSKRKFAKYMAIYDERSTSEFEDCLSSPKEKRLKCSSPDKKKIEYSGIQLLHSTLHSFPRPVSPRGSESETTREKSSNFTAEKSSKSATQKSSNDNAFKARDLNEQGPSTTSKYFSLLNEKSKIYPSPFKVNYEELNSSGVDDLINELLNSDDDDMLGESDQQELANETPQKKQLND